MKNGDEGFAYYAESVSKQTYEEVADKFVLAVSKNMIKDFLNYTELNWSDKIDIYLFKMWEDSKHGKFSRTLCLAEEYTIHCHPPCKNKKTTEFVIGCRNFFEKNDRLTEKQEEILKEIYEKKNAPAAYISGGKHGWSPMSESDYWYAELSGDLHL